MRHAAIPVLGALALAWPAVGGGRAERTRARC